MAVCARCGGALGGEATCARCAPRPEPARPSWTPAALVDDLIAPAPAPPTLDANFLVALDEPAGPPQRTGDLAPQRTGDLAPQRTGDLAPQRRTGLPAPVNAPRPTMPPRVGLPSPTNAPPVATLPPPPRPSQAPPAALSSRPTPWSAPPSPTRSRPSLPPRPARAIALSPEGAQRRAEATRALLAAAERDREAGHLDAAHAALELARRLTPDEPALARAQESLSRALPLGEPATPAARASLDAARAHRAAGRHADAIAALEASIAAEPSPAALHTLARLASAQLHDDRRAAELLARAAALGPDPGAIAAALARLVGAAPEPSRPSVGVLERWARAIER